MIKKIIIGVFVYFLFINFKIAYSEVFIKAKVNNQIITNIDVKNEKNYLLALNPNLRNLSQKNINLYAVDSAINERIKKIEIEKKFEITPDKKIVKKVITDLYSSIGINNLEEFEKYLLNYDINIGLVKKKIAVEIAWNDYIVRKFNSSILVDEDKIRDKINKISKNSSVENLLLSEIIFTINENENLKVKLNKINESIKNIGFEETAKIYSVSDSKKNGGKIGWVYKSQLSNKIFEQVKKRPKRVVFAEGEEEKVIRAAQVFRNAGYGTPVLIGRDSVVSEKMADLGLIGTEKIEAHNARLSKRNKQYTDYLYQRLARSGFLFRDCQRMVNQDRNIFAACMVACGDADAMVTGLTRNSPTCWNDLARAIFKSMGKVEKIFYIVFLLTPLSLAIDLVTSNFFTYLRYVMPINIIMCSVVSIAMIEIFTKKNDKFSS